MSTFDSRLINVGRAVPIHLHRFFTLALLLLIPLSAIDSAEGGTTLPPYLQRLPTRQEPKNERKKERKQRCTTSSTSQNQKRLCCIVFPLDSREEKVDRKRLSFRWKRIRWIKFRVFLPGQISSKVSHGLETLV